MDFWIVALAIWLTLLCTLVGVRMGRNDATWARGIAFEPTESIAAHQRFGLLLGANLALLERDDFNQLASRLPRRRVRRLLARYWNIHSACDFQKVVAERLRGLGALSTDEAEALDRLRHTARASYASWKDYSLSALVGMGVRGVVDLEDLGDWYHIARSHTVFLASWRLLLARASDWAAPDRASDVEPLARSFAVGMPTTAFDSIR